MTVNNNEVTQVIDASQVALDHCRKWENHYKLAGAGFQGAYTLSQFAAVVLSGITPILILMDNTPKYVQAIPPAVASISAGLAVYNWRLSWVRSRRAADSLENERVRFELRIGPDYNSGLSDEKVIENFIVSVKRIQNEALEEWQTIVEKEVSRSTPSEDKS